MDEQGTLQTDHPEVRYLDLSRSGKREGSITFLLKHGVWFWSAHEGKDLWDLAQWGDTIFAVERMCRRKGFDAKWRG